MAEEAQELEPLTIEQFVRADQALGRLSGKLVNEFGCEGRPEGSARPWSDRWNR